MAKSTAKRCHRQRVLHLAPASYMLQRGHGRKTCWSASGVEVLNLSQVGVYDNFFALGGHSLMAIRLISKVNRTLNVTLGVPELFQNPTIEQMARVIDGRVPMSKRRAAVI